MILEQVMFQLKLQNICHCLSVTVGLNAKKKKKKIRLVEYLRKCTSLTLSSRLFSKWISELKSIRECRQTQSRNCLIANIYFV